MADERRQDYVTKDDLNALGDRLTAHIDKSVDPLRLTLYGAEGSTGIVGSVNAGKTTVEIIKYVAGTGMLSGLWALIKSHMK